MTDGRFLFVLLALISIQCLMATPREEYTGIEAGVKAIGTVSEKLRHDINSQVKDKELQLVIDDIDRSMLGYLGTASKHLDELRHLNSRAHLKFSNVKDIQLEWCVSANSTLNFFIESITNPTDEEDRNIIWKSTMNSIASGVKKTNKAISDFEEMKQIRSQMGELLEVMEKDVKFDYSPAGYYGKKAMSKNSASSIPSIMTYLFILASTLQCAWARATHSSRVEREARINDSNEALSAEMLMKIGKAQSIATIDADLSDPKATLESLAQMISQSDKNQRVLLADSPALQANLLETLKSIDRECNQYVKWLKQ
ncbi:hypothetical protein KR074_006795 [Drosophila pseudoananassae]|nr:hypothetical protein KR074_006795 [Drosophila pseudoananassae]